MANLVHANTFHSEFQVFLIQHVTENVPFVLFVSELQCRDTVPTLVENTHALHSEYQYVHLIEHAQLIVSCPY